jgi:hypothetical protein
MNGFQFSISLVTALVSLISSLAWPVTVFAIVVMLRKPILARIEDLLRLDLPGGVKIEFAAGLKDVKADAVDAEITIHEGNDLLVATGAISVTGYAPEVTQGSASDSDGVDVDALSANPTGVVMEAWKSLERTLYAALMAIDPSASKNLGRGIQKLFIELESRGFLKREERDVLRGVLRLRNIAAHSEEKISAENATDFVRLAASLEKRYRERLDLLK